MRTELVNAIKSLKVGEGFEAGDLFTNLPSEEKVFWQLRNVKDSKYTFALHYAGVVIRKETLTIKNKKLKAGA